MSHQSSQPILVRLSKPGEVDRVVIAPRTLFDITIHALSGLQEVLESYQPDKIVVQGDTTTSFVGALAGFYTRTKISHIEAGLRSGDKFSPYPEEINRILTGHLTDYHFAPTDLALQNLYREGIRNNACVVGNTVIDALMDGLNIVEKEHDQFLVKHFDFIDSRRRTILITCHRRESFGKPIESIFAAIPQLAGKYRELQFRLSCTFEPQCSGASSDDGVVPNWSSHLDGATSEKAIHSSHSVQETPQAVLELKHILAEDIRDRAGASVASK